MRKHSKFSDKISVRIGINEEFIDTLNQRADAHNDFVDVTEHRMKWFVDAMDMLLDYLWKKDKTYKRLHWINLWIGLASLIAVWSLWAFVLTWN
jgi:hypothetical protein